MGNSTRAVGFNGGTGTTSAPHTEIITPIEGWTRTAYKSFAFYNDQACTIIINEETSRPISLRATVGFNSTVDDAEITSFVIEEAGITYDWMGGL